MQEREKIKPSKQQKCTRREFIQGLSAAFLGLISEKVIIRREGITINQIQEPKKQLPGELQQTSSTSVSIKDNKEELLSQLNITITDNTNIPTERGNIQVFADINLIEINILERLKTMVPPESLDEALEEIRKMEIEISFGKKPFHEVLERLYPNLTPSIARALDYRPPQVSFNAGGNKWVIYFDTSQIINAGQSLIEHWDLGISRMLTAIIDPQEERTEKLVDIGLIYSAIQSLLALTTRALQQGIQSTTNKIKSNESNEHDTGIELINFLNSAPWPLIVVLGTSLHNLGASLEIYQSNTYINKDEERARKLIQEYQTSAIEFERMIRILVKSV
ncbi:MAG: hypothetical protein N2558_03985 [Patescibacteria group bacterium]|nr:hypothetical protein [Patescibacteria group bacterium]